MTKDTTKEAAVAAEALLLDDWFDAIEDGFGLGRAALSRRCWRRNFPRRCRVRALWSAQAVRTRAALSVVGVRHGHRGADADGHVWQDADRRAARSVDRRSRRQDANGGAVRCAPTSAAPAADALIAGAYLAGTNTRRVRRALNAVFAGPVGKDVVSRVWRKTKATGTPGMARSLAEEPIVRLILDGTVARVRLDRRATSISLLVALGVRADGQKMLLAIKSMGGEGEAAWRALLDDLVRRGLQNAGAGRHRRRAGPRKGGGGAVARHGCPTLHRAQASQSPRPRPSACTRKSRTTTAT